MVAPFLIGRNLGDPDALRVLFLKEASPDEYVGKMYCSVEIALLDVLGKPKGLPVSELIGGRVRDRIRLYGSAGMYMSPEQYAEEAAAIAELGFRAYKMRPALGPEEDLRDREADARSDGRDVRSDGRCAHLVAHGRPQLYPRDGRASGGAIAEYEIAWLEEPMPPDDHEAYRKLKEANFVPLASGEHEPNELRYMDLILTGAVDYVQMDVVCQGGYPIARRLMPEIAAAGLKFAFHSWGTALEVVAAAQLGICWPETVVEWLEYPCYSTATRAGHVCRSRWRMKFSKSHCRSIPAT